MWILQNRNEIVIGQEDEVKTDRQTDRPSTRQTWVIVLFIRKRVHRSVVFVR